MNPAKYTKQPPKPEPTAAKITEKHISVDDLLKEATAIWKAFKLPPTNGDDKLIEEKTAAIRKAHPDFMASHKIIGNYIAELGWFSKVAVQKYGAHIIANPWKTIGDMAESQAVYGMHVYTARTRGVTLRERMEVKRRVKAGLVKEYEACLELQKILKESEAKLLADGLAAKRADTAKYCGEHGRSILDIPIVAEWRGDHLAAPGLRHASVTSWDLEADNKGFLSDESDTADPSLPTAEDLLG